MSLDSEKMTQLMILGFTEREARLGLRACQGNVEDATIHISNQRQVHTHTQAGEGSVIGRRVVLMHFYVLVLFRSKRTRSREKEGREADDWRSSPSSLSWDTPGEKQAELLISLMET